MRWVLFSIVRKMHRSRHPSGAGIVVLRAERLELSAKSPSRSERMIHSASELVILDRFGQLRIAFRYRAAWSCVSRDGAALFSGSGMAIASIFIGYTTSPVPARLGAAYRQGASDRLPMG